MKRILVLLLFLSSFNYAIAIEDNQNNDLYSISYSHYLQGREYFSKGNFSLAIKEFETALNLIKEVGDKDGIVLSSYYLSSSYFKVKKYDLAYEVLINSSPFLIDLKEHPSEGDILKLMGIIQLEGGDSEAHFNLGGDYLKKALEAYDEKKDLDGLYFTLKGLRFYYLYFGYFDEGINVFEKYQEKFQANNKNQYSEEMGKVIEELKIFKQKGSIWINESWNIEQKNEDYYHIAINLSMVTDFNWPTEYEPTEPVFRWVLETSNIVVNYSGNRRPSIRIRENLTGFAVSFIILGELSDIGRNETPVDIFYFPDVMVRTYDPNKYKKEAFRGGEVQNLFLEFDTPRTEFNAWKSGVKTTYNWTYIIYNKDVLMKANDYFLGYPYDSPQIEVDAYRISWARSLTGLIKGIPILQMIKNFNLTTETLGIVNEVLDTDNSFINYFYTAKPSTQTRGYYEDVYIKGKFKPQSIQLKRTENREILVLQNDVLIKTYIYYNGTFSDIKLKLLKPFEKEYNVPKDLDRLIQGNGTLTTSDFSTDYLYIGKNDPYINEDNKYLLVFRVSNISDKNIEFELSYPLSLDIIEELDDNQYKLTYKTLYQPGRHPTFIEVTNFIFPDNYTIINGSEGFKINVAQNIVKFETHNEPFKTANEINIFFNIPRVKLVRNVWIISILGALIMKLIDIFGITDRIGHVIKDTFGRSTEKQIVWIEGFIKFIGPIGAIVYLFSQTVILKISFSWFQYVISIIGILIGVLILYLINLWEKKNNQEKDNADKQNVNSS